MLVARHESSQCLLSVHAISPCAPAQLLPVTQNLMLGDRREPIPRPLSPLRNAPPRGLEAQTYLSADHSSGSSASAQRRAQHDRDHAQQSQVSHQKLVAWQL